MRYRRNDRMSRPGAAAAELAVVAPVLIFLMVATVDFARVSYSYITITNCAENGALWACDPGTQSQSPYANVTAAAQADASNLSPRPTAAATYYAPNGTDSPTPVTDGYVEVTVRWTFTPISSYLGLGTVNLSRSVRMRLIPS